MDEQVWKQAGASGMLCVNVPEKYGGLGLDILFSAVHWEEQSYANTTGMFLVVHLVFCFADASINTEISLC
jgi:acyl-CoA dehydrogenase